MSILVFGIGCGKIRPEGMHSLEARLGALSVDNADVRQVATEQGEFTLSFLEKITQGNVVFSPYSLSMALGMTYLGARAETAEEMRHAMHDTLSQERFHAALNSLDQHVRAPPANESNYLLKIANAIWLQKGEVFETSYLDGLAKYYGVGIFNPNFVLESEKSRGLINAWTSQETNGKINNLVPQGAINNLTKLVLTNAVYLNAKWRYQFDKKDTRPGTFYGVQSTRDVDMMTKTQSVRYAKTLGWTAVQMPYMEQAELLILMPDDARWLNPGASLTSTLLTGVEQAMSEQQVTITMPKFKLESAVAAQEILTSLGMRRAFASGQADFSGIADKQKLYISNVLHRGFIEVDEQGTQAAVATAVVVGTKSAVFPSEGLKVDINHPFLFVIKHHSGAILFLGRITQL